MQAFSASHGGTADPKMVENGEEGTNKENVGNGIGLDPRLAKPFAKLQELINGDPSGGWQRCWEEGVTPWDLRRPTPIIAHLNQIGALPKGRALVPGCGLGYDVVEMACPDRYVVGLDISDKALEKAVEISSSKPNADYFTFTKGDFFTWNPNESFDLIFDYTFLVAFEPNKRSALAKRISELLKPDGELLTLIYPITEHVGGPPYKVSISDYEEILHPLGFKATSIVDNELAVEGRKGIEKLGRWKKSLSQF